LNETPAKMGLGQWGSAADFTKDPVCHVEQREGSMPVAGTPQKVLASHWISRANPTS
jgi:hypothetical protein